MIIREETKLYKGDRVATVQIRYDSWEDDYGSQCWTNEVYYKIQNAAGKIIEEKIVTPQCYTQLSDIFDCPPYYQQAIKKLEKFGFTKKEPVIVSSDVGDSKCGSGICNVCGIPTHDTEDHRFIEEDLRKGL